MWKLLAVIDGNEYWQFNPEQDGDVFKRRQSPHNFLTADGAPMGARWEGPIRWYERWIVGQAA